MTKLAGRPVRVLKLPCGHEKESRARHHSKVTCGVCGRAGAVTREMLAEAEGRAAGKPNGGRPKAASQSETRTGAAPGRWQPPPITPAAFTRSAGTCSCGQPRRWPRTGRGTMARCPSCGTWSLPPYVHRAHSAAAGDQQARSSQQRDAGHQELYVRIRSLWTQARELLTDPDVDEDAKARLTWLIDELAQVRKTRDAARLEELEDLAAGLDLGAEETAYDEPGDDDEIVDAEIVYDEPPAIAPPPPRPQLPRARGPVDYLAWKNPPPPAALPAPPPVPDGPPAWLYQPPAGSATGGDVRPRIARQRGLPVHDQVVARTLAATLGLYDANRAAVAEGHDLTPAEAMQAAGLYAYVPPRGRPVRRPRGFGILGRGGPQAAAAPADREPSWQAGWDAGATARARGQRR